MGQLVTQPALQRAVAQHHQTPAQRIDASAQAQGSRVGVGQKAVGQQWVFAQDVLKAVERLLGIYGFHQLEDGGVARLQLLVAQAVEHIVGRPPSHGHSAVAIQAQRQQGYGRQVFVHLPVQDGTGTHTALACAGARLQGPYCFGR